MMARALATAWMAAMLLVASPALGQVPAPAVEAHPGEALTDADIEKLREGLRSDKRQTTAETLQLTDAEAAKFWPVYDRYIADLTRINTAKYTLIQEYSEKFGSYSDNVLDLLPGEKAEIIFTPDNADDLKAAQTNLIIRNLYASSH